MIPVNQTILHDPENGKHGNCMTAVVASLLHLDVNEVPAFTDPEHWIRDLNQFLKPYGLAYITLPLSECLSVFSTDNVKGCYHEIAGFTERSETVLHATCGIDGVVVHDPHPGNNGLKQQMFYGFFIALEPWAVAALYTKTTD